MESRRLPLAGIRVTDMTLVLAGTGGASLLADWGAEVIRVEPLQVLQPATRGPAVKPENVQPYIDAMKNWYMSYPDWKAGERPWERYNFYHAHGKNKMTMTVDLRRPEGRDILKRMVQVSDVVMENNVSETVEKLGVDYPDLRRMKPDLIMLRMPAYGLSGPYRSYRSYGAQLEGAAGHTYLRGYPDSDPSLQEDIYFGDATVAAAGAVAVLIALHDLKRTGRGRLIEMAQVESLIPLFGEIFMDAQMNGRNAQPQGNDLYDFAPHNAYQCQGDDRWVAIAVRNDEEWQGLTRAMGSPPWATDPRFATQAGRYEHRRELDKLVNAWTLEHENRWVMETLQAHGVPAGVLNDDRDLLADPHMKARRFFERLPHPYTGTNWYPGIIWQMKRTANHVRFPPGTLGQYNPYVYRELLGVTEAEYKRLEHEGHISDRYGPQVD